MPTPLVIRDAAIHHDGSSGPGPVADRPLRILDDDGTDAGTTLAGSASATEGGGGGERPSVSTSGDITGSPRLLGYAFCFVSSGVNMISSSVYYHHSFLGSREVDYDALFPDSTYETIGPDWLRSGRVFVSDAAHLVEAWKVYGCIGLSAFFTLAAMVIVAAHFDSWLCPLATRNFFRDGSLKERNLILALTFVAAVGLHVQTSKNSVGEAQPNVFFSSWSNFLSVVMNYEIWRKSAGRNFTFEKMLWDAERPVLRHLFYLSVLTSITFLAVVDLYVNIHNFRQCKNLNFLYWTMPATGSIAGISWVVLLFHRRIRDTILWYAMTLSLTMVVMVSYGYAVKNITGGRWDLVSSPSNVYFGMWGAFICASSMFGSLIMIISRGIKRLDGANGEQQGEDDGSQD